MASQLPQPRPRAPLASEDVGSATFHYEIYFARLSVIDQWDLSPPEVATCTTRGGYIVGRWSVGEYEGLLRRRVVTARV